MKFIDLGSQQSRLKDLIGSRIDRVLAHGQYINGPETEELEARLASFVGVKHAVGCASGTDALLMALMAYGVGPGDAIFTTPFTFIATAEVISLLGAVPVFVDIDPKTFNLDPEKLALSIQAVQSGAAATAQSSFPGVRIERARGIIAVDLFGLPADYDRINGIAKDYGLFVIEDAAQSFGGEYKGGKCCSLGEIGCTSFYPAKPLGCYGDGGMCFTGDDGLADALRSVRSHGMGKEKYENVRIGINGRLDTLQAAILLAKFEIFPEEVEIRRQIATVYSRQLAHGSKLKTPQVTNGYRSAWAQYSVLAESGAHRSALQSELKKNGIPTAIYYPKPLHLQTAYAYLGYGNGDFPESESASERIFSVPMHPYLSSSDQQRILKVICGGA